ncbi:hypothetical protein A4X09_0g5019 [Tilletia walkeri]|uniref:Stealth protein CR3 conserved region 3 domain-containing protein n=1 Tax=Tilletia walkeri TaxID=117179 RepID=A0A8X7N578_9BASI|nr:hypothetical protein A4X09_0g5019 [Tilletia walkeri]
MRLLSPTSTSFSRMDSNDDVQPYAWRDYPSRASSSSLDLSISYHENDHLIPSSPSNPGWISASSQFSRANKRTKRPTLCRWSVLFAITIIATTGYVVYLNRALATSYLHSFLQSGTPTPLLPSKPDAEVEYSKNATKALSLPLPIHLHHPPPKSTSFPHFDLDYYDLPLEHRRSIKPIASLQPLLAHAGCAQQWVTNGTLCKDFPTLTPPSIDILYTWVNGTSPHSANRMLYSSSPDGWWEEHWRPDPVTEFNNRQKRARPYPPPTTLPASYADKLANAHKPTPKWTAPLKVDKKKPKSKWVPPLQVDNGDNRFRETSELKFSIRSSVRYIQKLGSIHVVSPDFARPHSPPSEELSQDRFLLPSDLLQYESSDSFHAFPQNKSSTALRAGQIPSWLDLSQKDILTGDNAIHIPPSAAKLNTSTLRMHHDWSSFTPSWLLQPSSIREYFTHTQVSDWKHSVLPTFNSMSIEAYLGDETGLGDVFVYANDDFFLSSPFKTEDVHTPLYGLVLRLQADLRVIGSKSGFLSSGDHIKGGEWPSYRRSGYLLDERFGRRDQGRMYMQHVHKSLHRSLLEESRIVFDKPIREAAGARFRGQGESVNTPFLVQMFVIERHREALLWTFFMLRNDVDGDGYYGRSKGGEWETVLREMGLGSTYSVRSTNSGNVEPITDFATALDLLASGDEELLIAVPRPRRSSLSQSTANLRTSSGTENWKPYPKEAASETSTYVFSHLDGYPFMRLGTQPKPSKAKAPPSHHADNDPNRFGTHSSGGGGLGGGRISWERPGTSKLGSSSTYFGVEPWPTYWPRTSQDERKFKYDPSRPACRIELVGKCLRKDWLVPGADGDEAVWGKGPKAEDVFKMFAFEKVECGDCLIQMLMHNSGQSGYSAFLPSPSLLFPSDLSSTVPPTRIPQTPQEPHLPLTPTFNTTTFSVTHIATLTGHTSQSRLHFATSLLTRYAYTLADSPIEFVRITVAGASWRDNAVTNAVWKADVKLTKAKKLAGFICLNDDIGSTGSFKKTEDGVDRAEEAVRGVVRHFMETRWPDVSPFERQ